jgi:hypothetical protein
MSNPGAKKETAKPNPYMVLLGLTGSVIVLIIFFVLKAYATNLVDLPSVYFLIALIPIGLGLIVGGYVSDLTAWDYKITFNVHHRVETDTMPVPLSGAALGEVSLGNWDATGEYDGCYEGTAHYMLSHVYQPSTVPGQKFEVFIFVVRHQRGTKGGPRESLPEIATAEFCFGPGWSYAPFLVTRESGGHLLWSTNARLGYILCALSNRRHRSRNQPAPPDSPAEIHRFLYGKGGGLNHQFRWRSFSVARHSSTNTASC